MRRDLRELYEELQKLEIKDPKEVSSEEPKLISDEGVKKYSEETPVQQEPIKDMSEVTPIDYQKQQENQSKEIPFGTNLLSTVEALKQAQKARDFNLFGSDIARAGALISQGITGIENKGLKEIAESTEKRADLPIQDLTQQIAIQEKDPNSAISQGYRGWLEQNMGIKIKGDASAADIKPFLTASLKNNVKQTLFQKGGVDENGNLMIFNPATGQYTSSGIRAREDLFQVKDPMSGEVRLVGRRAKPEGGADIKATIGGAEDLKEGKEFSRKNLEPKQRDALDKEVNRLDKLTKGADEQLAGVRRIRGLLSSGSKLTPAAIRTQMPRVMGEVGNLNQTEQDIWTGSQDWLSRIEQYLSTITTSELTLENKKEFEKLLDNFEKSAKDNLNIITGGSALQMEELYGIPPSFSKRVLLPAQIRKAKVFDIDKVTVEKDGKQYKLPRSQLEKAKKQGFTEIK